MRTLIAAVLLLLPGCASLNNAGLAVYTVEPFEVDGKTLCCKVSITNGKQIASLDAHIEKRGDDYTVDLKQRGIEAFKGQEIAATAATGATSTVAKAAGAVLMAPAVVEVGAAAIGAAAQ